jgi:hypothetical protein
MTLALEQRRRLRGAHAAVRTLELDLGEALFELHREASTIRWPSTRYSDDPIRFHHEILGIEPWSKQADVIRSVRENPLTSVKSGHRVGKSYLGAGVGLWFYSSFDDARVVMTAPGARPACFTTARAAASSASATTRTARGRARTQR